MLTGSRAGFAETQPGPGTKKKPKHRKRGKKGANAASRSQPPPVIRVHDSVPVRNAPVVHIAGRPMLPENVLKGLGFHDVRVRHHELRVTSDKWQVTGNTARPSDGNAPVTCHVSPVTHLARIEVGATELPRFLENDLSARVADALKRIGYSHVTLDLLGYRRGSQNARSDSRNPQPERREA